MTEGGARGRSHPDGKDDSHVEEEELEEDDGEQDAGGVRELLGRRKRVVASWPCLPLCRDLEADGESIWLSLSLGAAIEYEYPSQSRSALTQRWQVGLVSSHCRRGGGISVSLVQTQHVTQRGVPTAGRRERSGRVVSRRTERSRKGLTAMKERETVP